MQNVLKYKNSGLIFCIFFSFIYLTVFYHEVLFHPNKYLFASEGDGIKNYYNYVWHIKHDKSFSELQNLSYPFGEDLLMEDSLPVYSSFLKVISGIFPSISYYTIGILNFLLLISLVIGAIFIYLILLHYSLPPLLSAISGTAVSFLSSQVLLLNPPGHYGLSFICFFPIGWYLLIKYFEGEKQMTWSLLIILNIIFWTYTHVYLGCILLLFTICTHLFKAITEFKYYIKNPKEYVYPVVQVIVPAFLILLLVHISDHHPDRVNLPLKLDYISNFKSIFTPVISPLKPFYEIFFDLTIKDELSWNNIGNYIGLTSNLAIIVFCILSLAYFLRRNTQKILVFFPNKLYLYILPAMLMLLYSMAIPFRYLPHSFLDSFPILKQFSSFGRFAWAFYYVIVIFSIVFLYKILFEKRLGKVLLYILVLVYFVEGSAYHIRQSKEIHKVTNVFNYKYLPEDEKILTFINGLKFQAILPLPYFFIYGLPFEKANSLNSISCSMIASYYSGLPIMSTYYSRPSVSESLDLFKQLLPVPYRVNLPVIRSKEKDIALVINNEDFRLLNEYEKNILAKSSLYLRNVKYSIYNLAVKNLAADYSLNVDNLYDKIEREYFHYKGLMVRDTNRFLVYNNFDFLNSKVVYRGNGAAQGIKTDFDLLLKTSTEKIDTSRNYIISFWYYNHLMDQTYNTVVISETDINNGILQLVGYSPVDANIVDGWWYLSEFKFKVRSNNSTLKIFFHGEDFFEKWFAVDEFLIRPVDVDVYQLAIENGRKTVYLNNRKCSQ